jgi:hypothetical protein
MTSDFSAIFTKTSNPSQTQLDAVAAAYPSELVTEGFSFSKPDGTPSGYILPDAAAPAGMVTIPSGAFSDWCFSKAIHRGLHGASKRNRRGNSSPAQD